MENPDTTKPTPRMTTTVADLTDRQLNHEIAIVSHEQVRTAHTLKAHKLSAPLRTWIENYNANLQLREQDLREEHDRRQRRRRQPTRVRTRDRDDVR